MARDRERRGLQVERERVERQTRLVYIGVGASLGVAALLILAGLYVTHFQPPRAHVVSVADASYQAREVVDRGVYLTFLGSGPVSNADIARDTVATIIEDEALRQVGSQFVDLVTEADIREALEIDLGLVTAPILPPSQGDDGTATPEPTLTPEPTTVIPVDPQEFAGLDRDDYEGIIEARLYRERLEALFAEEVGTSGPQIRLQRIRVSTQFAAGAVIADLEGGADFATLAAEQSVAIEDGEGGDLGWSITLLQEPNVQAAIDGLEVGEWTAAIPAGLFFEMYLVAEVAEDREYEVSLTDLLLAERVDEWMVNATASLDVNNDMSAGEEVWINDHVLADVTARLGG
jgi:hypothetical protein